MPIADKDVKWVTEPKMGLSEMLYLPAIFQGLTTTVRHMFSQKVTEQYPGGGAEPAAELSRRASAQPRRSRAASSASPATCARRPARPTASTSSPPRPRRMEGPREVSRDVRHRRAALHLLRHVRAGLPVRRDRADHAVRPDRPEPRGDDVRQGEAAQRVRPDGARRHRPDPHEIEQTRHRSGTGRDSRTVGT